MPPEWNTMVADMYPLSWVEDPPKSDLYYKATLEETSEHVKFHAPEGHTMRIAKLSLESTPDYERSLATLRAQYECPKPVKVDAKLRVDKGKGKATTLDDGDIPQLHKNWFSSYTDMLNGTSDRLPPFHEVNHEINLIDEDRRYKYHLPHCPNSLWDEFYDKLNQYQDMGWWEARSVTQAAPLLCLAKKDNHLQTVINACQ
ncbi:hypothetical protein BDQ17DRAFT_1420113 [Cyathus striatus]|nr:hypothetical protein BDQ17DRAFT_1420113 [Cyathus striatus]